MNAPLKQAGLALACCLPLLLAACGSSSSDSTTTSGPTLDVSLSQPNLQTSLEPGDSGNFYVYFSGATSEELASNGNPDNLGSLTIDPTGATGKVTIDPVSTTMPGIYSLIINGDVSGATTQAVLNVNIYPVGNLFGGHPTIMTLTKDATQPTAGQVNATVTFPATAPLRNGLNLISGSTALVVPAGTKGITVNSTTVTAAATTNNPDAVTVSASITVVPSEIVPGTVTDASGNTYSHGLQLTLTASPPANGYSEQSYAELVYIDNLTTL